MHHIALQRARSSRFASSLLGGSILLVPTSYASAAPLDGIFGANASPAFSFGVGCAVGTVVAGLVVGLVGRRSRRGLKEELSEVVAIAERAEEAARRAEALLAQGEGKAFAQAESATTVESASEVVGVTAESEQTRDLATDSAVAADSASAVAETVNAAGASANEGVEVVATLAGTSPERTVVSRTSQQGRGVRSILQDRLGTNVFDSVPVIDRGQERPATGPLFAAVPPRARREFDPVARAAVIDRRVPRFDESLFPDPLSDQGSEDDIFEVAMRAMDDSLSDVNVGGEAYQQPAREQPAFDFYRPQDHPEVVDAESYIEYLVQDELERNRSGQARRFSRAHLTIFEGTGDLRAMSQAKQYRPRHMQAASREA